MAKPYLIDVAEMFKNNKFTKEEIKLFKDLIKAYEKTQQREETK